MNLISIDEKIIVSPEGLEVPADFKEKYLNESGKAVCADDLIRLEHPHCAFFKSTQFSDGKEYQRTTLYTQEGRLHSDRLKEEGAVPEKYVKKCEQLEILLLYLRDVEVKPSLFAAKTELETVIMPLTPLAHAMSFLDEKLLNEIVTDYEAIAKHIMSQLKRIYNSKLEILLDKLQGKIKYAVFEDINGIDIDDEIVERWHSYYIRKSRFFK